MQLIRHRAYARAGLLGNPSDGYHGKTISLVVRNFHAEVVLYEWEDVEIVLTEQSQSRFDSVRDLVLDVRLHGYYGGIRLIKATIKKFVEYCDRRRQKRRLVLLADPFLHLDLRDQDARRNRRDRNRPRFRTTGPVEDRRIVARVDDLGEARQRRAHDVNAAHQLIRSAIRVDLVDHHRQDLEGLGPHPPRAGEAAGDILEQKSVGLVLPLALFDQQSFELV